MLTIPSGPAALFPVFNPDVCACLLHVGLGSIHKAFYFFEFAVFMPIHLAYMFILGFTLFKNGLTHFFW